MSGLTTFQDDGPRPMPKSKADRHVGREDKVMNPKQMLLTHEAVAGKLSAPHLAPM